MAEPAQPGIPSEVLGALYGGIVRQLVADMENEQQVNAQLRKFGKNIGSRLVDEYLATTRRRVASISGRRLTKWPPSV